MADFPPKLLIDEDAAAVLNSAVRAVKTILDCRFTLDREDPHKLLAVVAGESHNMPAQYVHHMLVLKGLQEKEPAIAASLEAPHNFLTEVFKQETFRWIYPADQKFCENLDKDGAMTLKTFLGFGEVSSSAHAHAIFFNFLLRHAIPARFADAVSRSDGYLRSYLDGFDESTAQSLRACGGDEYAIKAPYSPEGVEVRNHHIASRALELAEAGNARIIFQQCGSAHVAGDREFKFSGSKSLSALFRQAGARVLAAPIFDKNYQPQRIPDDCGLAEDEKLFLENIPEVTASYPHDDVFIGNKSPDLATREEEAAYVNGLLARTGLADECLSIPAFNDVRARCKSEMQGLFRKWDRHLPVL